MFPDVPFPLYSPISQTHVIFPDCSVTRLLNSKFITTIYFHDAPGCTHPPRTARAGVGSDASVAEIHDYFHKCISSASGTVSNHLSQPARARQLKDTMQDISGEKDITSP